MLCELVLHSTSSEFYANDHVDLPSPKACLDTFILHAMSNVVNSELELRWR
jgi:hypothetical protein